MSACCSLPPPSGTTATDRALSPQAAPKPVPLFSEEKDGPPRFLGNPCVNMPCSLTPVAPRRQAFQAGRYCLPQQVKCRQPQFNNFDAPSHGLFTRGLRFAVTVTWHHARLASGWWLALAGWDFHPLGFISLFPLRISRSFPNDQALPGALPAIFMAAFRSECRDSSQRGQVKRSPCRFPSCWW